MLLGFPLSAVNLVVSADIEEENLGRSLDVDYSKIASDREGPIACELTRKCVVIKRSFTNSIEEQP